ncbi:hypothetical protein ACU81Q_10265 [Komagataeibacter melomenusus]
MESPQPTMEDSVSGKVIEEKPFKRSETLEEKVVALEALCAALEALLCSLMRREFPAKDVREANASVYLSCASKPDFVSDAEWEAVKHDLFTRIMAQSR